MVMVDSRDGFLAGDPDAPIGARIERTVSADTFEGLMQAIDMCEDELLTYDRFACGELQALIRGESDSDERET